MTKLSVNINKVATIRNARGGNNPDVLRVAKDCEAYGAQGITVHPRPDERHIRYNDVYNLKPLLKTEFKDRFTSHGIRTSIFVGTELENLEWAAKTGTDRVELYTEPYASGYAQDRDKAIAPFIEAAQFAKNQGLGVNAGHDLSLENLAFFSQNIPWLEEVSIGHALICDALYLGLKETIAQYKACLQSNL